MNTNRKIIHIDMDAFFASIEQKDNPQYQGLPLIVGGSPQGRGVVAACSYEARKFGIHSAMPCAKAARLCPDAIFTRPRMERYKEISTIIMAIFREYTDRVEPLSVDEAFLDVTINYQNEPSATRLAETIRSRIYQETGLTASAGISFNKFLAKVASDQNKPDGATTIPPDKARAFLDALPIRKFFGVGKVTEKKMLQIGIKTGSDLRSWEKQKLLSHFGKTGAFLYNCVRGIDDRDVESVRIRKSIGSEKTLAKDTNDLIEINALIFSLAEKIEYTLLVKNSGGHTLTLKLRYSDFTTITRSITSPRPIFASSEIMELIPRLLMSAGLGTKKIRLVGLSVSKLVGDKKYPRQLLLPFPKISLKRDRNYPL